MKTSMKLRGMTYHKIWTGKILIFQSTIHNITNTAIQEINEV
jgi:hypothetical protein